MKKEDTMKGLKIDFSTGKAALMKMHLVGKYFLTSFKRDWPIPEITYPNQIRVKTRMGGICASDFHMMMLDISYFASILVSPENPSPMGHELVGEVVEMGHEASRFTIGDRVTYMPVAACNAYGFKPCTACQRGNMESCVSMAGVGDGSDIEKSFRAAGGFGGFSGGGFCEYLTAFENQFFKVPDSVSDRIAVLSEPFAIAIHAVSRNMPLNEQTIVVVGAGIIGLLIIVGLRLLGFTGRIITIARYPFQEQKAKELGADLVIRESDRETLYDKVAEATGARLFKPMVGKRGVFGNNGPDLIFDCVGTEETVDDSLHLVRSNGKIVIVGQAYAKTKKVDWAIQLFKEVTIVGASLYGSETYKGKSMHAFELSIRLFKENSELFSGLVTHTFALEDYKNAFACAVNKAKTYAIKTVFSF